MKNKCIKHCLGIMALLLFFAACRKDESDNGLQVQQALQVQKFLTLPPDADAGLVRIAAKLSELNNSKSVIPGLADKYGYPEWEYALHAEKGTTVNKYIPLVNNNNKTVEAVIQCILKDGSVYLGLITRNNIKDIIKRLPDTPDKPDELTFRALFWEFGDLIYGHPLTWIVDMDENRNILREYPATEEQKNSWIMTKAMNCHWVGIGGGDMYDEHGNYVGGGTDIRWEWRCKWVADETVDWDASPEEGVIWDDPGSGGGPQPEPQPDEPKNPCDRLNNFIGKDANFISGMKQIQRNNNNNTAKDTEYAMYLRYSNTQLYNGNFTQGKIRNNGTAELLLPSAPFDMLMHTHPQGTNSMFSLTDIKTIYDLQQAGMIKDISNFAFGVVTGDGTTYMLMIEDPASWNVWSKRMFEYNSGDILAIMYKLIRKKYGIEENSNITNNEKGFIKFLENTPTGLKLHKGNATTFTTWERQTINAADTVYKDDCK